MSEPSGGRSEGHRAPVRGGADEGGAPLSEPSGASTTPRLPPDARSAYGSEDPPEDEGRALKHRLVAETKRAIDAVALLDLTAADLDEVAACARATADLAARLAAQPSLRRRGGAALAGGPDATLLERSGISGRSNPLAPPLHLSVNDDDGTTRAWAVWTDAYEGPPGCLHGGFVAAAFDDLMGVAQMASGIAGFTGTLTIRMRRPTPLHRRIDYEAGLESVAGRKITVWGRSWAGQELLAEATILFIAPRGGPLSVT
jgi:acyl-coenzyme A thioesterase PaaI-like protein